MRDVRTYPYSPNHKTNLRLPDIWRGMPDSMKRIWIITLLFLLIGTVAASAKKAQEGLPEYEIQGAGTGTQGTYLVQVTITTKDKNLSEAMIKRVAVNGVLFRGFSDTTSRKTQKPLAGSAANEAQHADFYKEFFGEGGTAASYANIVPGSRSMTKVDKMYRVKATVSVNKESLVKYLQDVGVIKGLNSIF